MIFAAFGFPSQASAQLGGLGRGGLGSGLGQTLGRAGDILPQTARVLDPQDLVAARLQRLDDLVRAHPKALEQDDHGAPVVRGEVLAVAPTPQSLEIAHAAGFDVLKAGEPGEEAAGVVLLATPSGLSVREAVKRLRKLDPAGVYDFNHIYLPATGMASKSPAPSQAAWPVQAHDIGTRIGLIDTGVDIRNIAFKGAMIEQRAFSGASPKPASHGTEVASLLVGEDRAFHAAAAGASLFAADIYGDDPAGGSADALIRALFWLAGRKVQVINVSLVGPPNAALSAGVRALTARGVLIVAAVGNDGPASPLAYPASYPGVVAVTGVDARGRVLIEAGRAEHLDFAAPGADMAAAALGGGYVAVRGTSFAAPFVTGRLAELASKSANPSSVIEMLAVQAGKGRGYGRGLVAMDRRTPPAAVHAKAGE